MAETVITCTHEGAEHVWQPGEGCPDAIPAGTWAVRPAPLAAEGTDELREQVAAWEFARHAPARYWGTATLAAEQEDAYEAAEEVMALPALAPLLVKCGVLLAKVQAVEALVEHADDGSVRTVRAIRRALGGESRG